MNELSLWDYFTLGATFLGVSAYFILRIKRALAPNKGGGCGGCGKGACQPGPSCAPPAIKIERQPPR